MKPAFETERLILRAVTLDDVPAYEKYFINFNVVRYLSAAVPWPYPKGGVEQHFKEQIFPFEGKTIWKWGIYLKDNPSELIGAIDLWLEGRPEHRGFWLGEPFWGKGIMTEAVEPIMNFAFNELGFDKLVFANAKGNPGSRRIKEKTGARLIDVRPGKFIDEEFVEQEVWELEKREWEKRK